MNICDLRYLVTFKITLFSKLMLQKSRYSITLQ